MRERRSPFRLAILRRPGSAVDARLGPGRFAEIAEMPLEADASRLQALDRAESAGCDWMMVIEEGETLCADALAIAAPAVGLYDAIFGGVRIDGAREPLWKPSRLAFDTPQMLPHAMLSWWIGRSPLIATARERQTLDSLEGREDSASAYLFALWSKGRCIKLAPPFVRRKAPPPAITLAERAAILRHLSERPVFLDIAYGHATYRLPYTGRNAGIEREQTRGLFFEAAELGVLRERLGSGARIVDVGANTGNHTVFFAGPMQASTVTPFEPVPEIAAILRRTVTENNLANVDLSHLGLGVSDRPGRARVLSSVRGGLGASSLGEDDTGEIEVVRLDDVLTGGLDFLKIDAETMEMKVLAGARETIERLKPVIFVEVSSANTTTFLDWLDQRNYAVRRVFSDKGHANYLVEPCGEG